MWPTAPDFSEAIQNPRVAFTDADLRSGVPATDRLGMPVSICGQFAVVFKFKSSGGRVQAIRCFTRGLGDRAKRYKAIDAHLDKYRHVKGMNCLAKYEYEPNGILVKGQRYPTLQMEWIEGNALDVYVGQVLKKREVLLHLANEWVNLIKSLREANIAHGDLQHGNIIVDSNARLRLVDLDGLYVPEMDGLKACELGHPNYQHPKRGSDHFGLYLDNFSSLVIYFSILALAYEPELWSKYHDDGLILKKQDFKDPANSPLFKDVYYRDTEFKRIARILIESCEKKIEKIPSVMDVADAKPVPNIPDWMRAAPAGSTVETKSREFKQSEVRTAPLGVSSPVTPQAKSSGSGVPRPSSRVGSSGKFNMGKALGAFFTYLISKIIIFLAICGFGKFDSAWVTLCSFVYVMLAFIYAREEGASKAPVAGNPASSPSTASPSRTCPACHEPNNPVLTRCWKCKKPLVQSATPIPNPIPTPSPASTGFGSGGPYYKPVGRAYSGSYGSSGSHATASAGAATQGTAFYMASRTRRKYHDPLCEWALKISPRNQITFSSKSEAARKGYQPCTACNP